MTMENDARLVGVVNDMSGASAMYRPAVLTAIAAVVKQINLPIAGKQYVLQALAAPSRSTGGGHSNLSGQYTSLRMGVTLSFESGELELSTADELEADLNAVAWFDQAPKIKITYQGKKRKVGYFIKPDWLVLYPSRGVMVECKPLAVIRERAESDPNLYVQKDGIWTSPPAQESAAKLGFEYELWTEEKFSAAKLANFRLLKDYYIKADLPEEVETAQRCIVEAVGRLGAPTIAELLEETKASASIDNVYRAIARRQLHFDIAADDLTRFRVCRVFRDMETLAALKRAEQAALPSEEWAGPVSLDLKAGLQVLWDGVVREVSHVGDSEVVFKADCTSTSLAIEAVRKLLNTGVIRELTGPKVLADARKADAHEFLLSCSPKDLKVATLRQDRLRPHLAGVATAPPCRTLRRYLAQFRKAESAFGNGFLGLVPKFSACGNREGRLQTEVVDLVVTAVNEKYLNNKNVRRIRVFESIVLQCEEKGLPAPSYSWFCRYLANLDKYKVKAAREGSKAAYGIAPRTLSAGAEGLLGEPVRPFERAHVDHTQMDVESVFSETAENLGRAWLTVMIDHYSRRILGFFISYEPPSYRAVLMTLRDCVRRYGRLPSTIVVDGGKEFRSIWFEVVCAFFGITVLRRPPRKGRFGAQIERFFGTENSVLLHSLTGNTQLRKNVRQMTPAVDPSKVAIWDLPSLHELHEAFLFEQYDTTEHLGILMQPRQAFIKGMGAFGARPERLIRYDQAFLILTCPSTDKGTARVQPDGVKVNYFYFNAPALHAYLGKDVPVRYEPFDLGTAYAFVGGRWITLHSRFERLLRGLTERELEFLCTEYKKRYGDVARRRLSDTKLAKFMEEVEKTEAFLQDRKRALELKKILGGEQRPPAAPEGKESESSLPTSEPEVNDEGQDQDEEIVLEQLETY